MLTLLLIYRAVWGGPDDRVPRLLLAAWVALSLCMPFQFAVPVALAGEVPMEVAALGRESLLGAMESEEGMPHLSLVYLPCGDVLGVLTPENALVLTSMDDFRRLMRP